MMCSCMYIYAFIHELQIKAIILCVQGCFLLSFMLQISVHLWQQSEMEGEE